ncbi:alanine racemase [Brevibacterium sp. BDJS002]|uniref:alanine racemase n=1 Tax=Brevibacterium TaxID=1696 RepID=UPI0023075527|nr:alanine racemase [Brevibacterium sp. BDJS002]MDN5775158.1 alanine racemase [Brevibacterium aurantiacum]WCE39245.1 alanine racemase [Brevibacterium sp. BDJS002]
MTSTDTSGALVRAEIDVAALQANAAALAERLAPARLKCVVKANAYGHGIDIVAPALFAAGWRDFCVATISEALHLRELLGDEVTITAWLYGPTTDLDAAVAAGIELGVSTVDSLDRLRDASRRTNTTARLHLKVDTGLGRNGLAPADWKRALEKLRSLDTGPESEESDVSADAHGLEIVGIMSHYAVADEPERVETAQQTHVFDSAHRELTAVLDEARGRLGESDGLEVHIANSPAALTLSPFPGTSARVGLSLYGLSPLEDQTAQDLGLVPVMRLVSQIVNLKDVPSGHGASYGLTFTAAADTRFALVPGGYGDGLARSASNRAEVSIRGTRYPVIGRIAMDQMIVEVGAGEVAIGDEVVIFGPDGPSAAEWGTWADTINYEVVSRISERVDRVEVEPHPAEGGGL